MSGIEPEGILLWFPHPGAARLQRTAPGPGALPEPGVHFGFYTPENFHDEAVRWLHDEKRRHTVGRAAKKVIKERHCWHHRAQQIIDDLKR